MKSCFAKIALFFLLTLNFSFLSAYGLLQGKVKSEHGAEKQAFIQKLYGTYSPFYTGPLLAPSAHAVPYGYYNIQPYYFLTRNYGNYSRSWRRQRTRSSLQHKFLSIFQYGLTQFMDVNIQVQGILNRKEDQHWFGYGDTNIAAGFQLTEGVVGTAMPSSLLQISLTFPSGKYRHMKASKLGTDSTGSGAYGTNFSLNFQKNFNSIFKKDLDPTKFHPFLFRWNVAYTINSRTTVKGINAYGGGPNTLGTVKVGNNFTSIFAWEFSFTEHWVFATDWQYTATGPSKFSGNDGGVPIGAPGNQNWSVAPAIEYNINGNFGALAGVWFSLTGRNSEAFVAWLASFTWLF